jgi:uncharacterized Rossmann fold enzyme
MEPIYWLPYYDAIAKDLGIDAEKDTIAARMLADGLKKNGKIHPRDEVLMELERTIEGKDVLVFGAGPDLEMELDKLVEVKRTGGRWKIPSTAEDVIIAADGATSTIMSRGLVPHIIVTDLDGGTEDQIHCLSRGSIMLVHGHGDNMKTISNIVPRLFGSVLGTTQVDPSEGGGLDNFGGFTDGDRAAFTAQHFGARSIMLLGFNFNEVGPKITDGGIRISDVDPMESEFKFKKLAWANILLGLISNPQVQLFSGDPMIRL